MAKRGILKHPDGSISIVVPSERALEHRTLAEILAKSNPDNLPMDIVEDTEIPTDRVFRNAWTKPGATIEVDRSKAEDLHMDRLRFLRKGQFEKLDKDFQKADDDNDNTKKNEIKDKRKKLRDMPTTFDLTPITIEDLPSAKPAYLDGDPLSLKRSVPQKDKL